MRIANLKWQFVGKVAKFSGNRWTRKNFGMSTGYYMPKIDNLAKKKNRPLSSSEQ